MFEKRMGEISRRKLEIEKMLRDGKNADGNALTTEDCDAFEKELRALNEEYSILQRRAAMISDAAPADTTPAPANPITGAANSNGGEPSTLPFTRENVLASKEYRSAWAKTLMHRNDITDIERRALDTAFTTTATTYVAPSAGADGVNNGGLLIPTDINLALMDALSLASPIFRDIAKTSIPGVIKFPYKVSASGAKSLDEGDTTNDMSIQWADLTLGTVEVAETIRVSWRLEAMAVDQFIGYITNELIDACTDFTINDTIYGTGAAASSAARSHCRGVTLDAVTHEYTGSILDAIGAGLKKLTAKLKRNAKIYVSSNSLEEMYFLKDSKGTYIYNPINNSGIKSAAGYTIEADPYLNDGDFVIGNLGKYYRFNTIEPMSLTKDSSGKKRANDYTVFTLIGGAAQPNTLLYGYKQVEQQNGGQP